MTDSDQNCHYVSSRGILKSCDIYDSNPRSSNISIIDINNIKKNDTVYICNLSIQYFYKYQFKNIKVPFILVSGDSDEITPFEVLTTEQFDDFINSDTLIHWFAVNCFMNHPKMTRIPYGLDYHTQTVSTYFMEPIRSPIIQEQLLVELHNTTDPFYERIPYIYIDHLSPRCIERYIAYNTVSSGISFKEPSRINRSTVWKNQTNFSFVLSPPALDIPDDFKLSARAGGFDCIRTWEALILGCIPIVKSSQMDPLYDDLPVWIINDWNEVNDREKLIAKIQEFKDKKFNYDKLTLKYWVDLFNSKKIE